MDENLLDIKQYRGEGFRPLIDFGEWRVAILRWEPSMQPEKIELMERHTQTDEVFVLLEGQATIILGGKQGSVEGVYPQTMENGKLYNVKCNVWHTVVLSRDASILIVEQQNTGLGNSEFCHLSGEFKNEIMGVR